MKRFALIATLLATFFVSTVAPAKAGVFVYRRPVAPVRTALRVAAPPYRALYRPRVYAGPGAYYGYPGGNWGPAWGYGPGVSVGVGVY
jgi:hypothetical protein